MVLMRKMMHDYGLRGRAKKTRIGYRTEPSVEDAKRATEPG